MKEFKQFDKSLKESELFPLATTGIEVFQINFGRLCNQACLHCHVEAGPKRTEIMDKATMELCLEILSKSDIPTVDLTGGAPEMNPHFKWFVEECNKINKHILVRSNLTTIEGTGYEYLVKFYKSNKIEVIASLPYYLEKNVDKQRGEGTFEKSIQAIKKLNEVGYGCENTDLLLNLVYNPGGAFLPPSQCSIEKEFRKELDRRFGVKFSNLFTITNLPIGRFRDFLVRTNNYDAYLNRLIDAYNPIAAAGVMCRYTLSVSWDGSLYDCDFNQMLGVKCDHGAPYHIKNFDLEKLKNRRIMTGLHCYGCTAGAGSSCGGAVVD